MRAESGRIYKRQVEHRIISESEWVMQSSSQSSAAVPLSVPIKFMDCVQTTK